MDCKIFSLATLIPVYFPAFSQLSRLSDSLVTLIIVLTLLNSGKFCGLTRSIGNLPENKTEIQNIIRRICLILFIRNKLHRKGRLYSRSDKRTSFQQDVRVRFTVGWKSFLNSQKTVLASIFWWVSTGIRSGRVNGNPSKNYFGSFLQGFFCKSFRKILYKSILLEVSQQLPS